MNIDMRKKSLLLANKNLNKQRKFCIRKGLVEIHKKKRSAHLRRYYHQKKADTLLGILIPMPINLRGRLSFVKLFR